MPRSSASMNFISVVARRRREYNWPEIHLTVWTIFMIVAGLFLITNFAALSEQQTRLKLGLPWIISYGLTIGVLTELFVWTGLLLSFQRKLSPGIVLLSSFILLVLYLAGAIGTGIQLFGPVISACRKSANEQNRAGGDFVGTLAWLNQHDTCMRWYVVFSFWVAGNVMLVWMLLVARSVLLDAD